MFKNKWHFPGGLIEKNISLKKMVKIMAKREVNLEIKIDKFLGVYELITPQRHDISHLYLAHYAQGTIKLDFHGLFCNSRLRAKLNTVTKLKTKKNTVFEIKFSWKNKCVHSSLWP